VAAWGDGAPYSQVALNSIWYLQAKTWIESANAVAFEQELPNSDIDLLNFFQHELCN